MITYDLTTVVLNKALAILFSLITIIFKIAYAAVIYSECDFNSTKQRKFLTFLSVPFPIITGIVCMIKNRKNIKNVFIIFIVLLFYLASAIGTVYFHGHSEVEEVVFNDFGGNEYTFDFEKTGYDYLYINGTKERLNADLCYLDADGYLHYDEDLSITAKDETCCVDKDGSLYYPAKYITFNEDGTVKYNFNSANFNYDRFGNAYTYDYVPYYDADGNKYFYSFDSVSQKGLYTNVVTKETFDNDYCFVDENGFFVYDEKHSFIEQKDIKNVPLYSDSEGKIFYWASGVFWNGKGELLDSFGNVIK